MTDSIKGDASPPSPPIQYNSDNQIDVGVFRQSRLVFYISGLSFLGLLGLIFVKPILFASFGYAPITQLDPELLQKNPAIALLAEYFVHLLLFMTTVVSGYIGYKLVIASGASPENPIPPGNYRLLAPLIEEAKSESIDQYVRLSSLSGFTGMFTKLGLTGLPLTTVALTLIFAVLAMFPLSENVVNSFIDLTKLTLGAFIGSFVQRQVEQRRAPDAAEPDDQSRSMQ